MKKVLFLLVFIPLASFGQTYNDVMSIGSVDMFVKVAIENGYEFNSTDEDGWVTYGYNIDRDSIEGNKSNKWIHYNKKDHRFSLALSRENIISNFLGTDADTSENPYDLIVKEIKEKCKYYKIQNYKGTDFVTYSCSDSSYKGKIGFMVEEGWGYIRHFPNE